jgi:tetratricopeptide (TPR) repeat protein
VTSRVDDGHRRLVPRWRYSNRTIVGYEHAGDPRDKSTRAPKFAPIEPVAHAWQQEQTYVSAVDLVSAAVVLAQPELAVAPSEWLLSRSHKIPADVRNTAGKILRPSNSLLAERLPEQNLQVGITDARAIVAFNRHQLSEYVRSASRWMDLSLAHAVLGNRNKALRSMRSALSIEPNNRNVLRAAVRLLVHLGSAEEAFEHLRRHRRTRFDPWLLSQDITVAQILGRDPCYLTIARRLLRENALPAGHLTELASAMGTFESKNIDLKHARKLHRFSLIAPTDNVLAQVEWLRQRDPSLPQGNSAAARGAMEANFWNALLTSQWDLALKAAFQWQNDEPYSTRPALAGSFLTSSILGDFKVAEEFARFGLRADPADSLLKNNLVVAMARQSKLSEAAPIFSTIRPDDRLNTYTYRATQGLLKYAVGDELGGAEDYKSAINLASDVGTELMVRASWLDTQARWGAAIDQELLQRVKTDAARPGYQVAQGVALSALSLIKRVQEDLETAGRPPKRI